MQLTFLCPLTNLDSSPLLLNLSAQTNQNVFFFELLLVYVATVNTKRASIISEAKIQIRKRILFLCLHLYLSKEFY